VTAAIFGLLGVLVGGVLNGVVQWRLDIARQRAAARGARRLVGEEMLRDLTAIASSVSHGTTVLLRELSKDAWAQHREALAGVVTDDEWFRLVEGYASVQIVREIAPVALDADYVSAMSPEWSGALEVLTRDCARDLVAALQALGTKDPRVEQLVQIIERPIGSLRGVAE
jgi:hypothetical protein